MQYLGDIYPSPQFLVLQLNHDHYIVPELWWHTVGSFSFGHQFALSWSQEILILFHLDTWSFLFYPMHLHNHITQLMHCSLPSTWERFLLFCPLWNSDVFGIVTHFLDLTFLFFVFFFPLIVDSCSVYQSLFFLFHSVFLHVELYSFDWCSIDLFSDNPCSFNLTKIPSSLPLEFPTNSWILRSMLEVSKLRWLWFDL